MTIDCQQAIEYILLQRKDNIDQLNESESYETYYFYNGKVYAYNEILRILQDD